MTVNISKPIAFIVLAALFASCNLGNKIVSSMGKRKYTKGYYFNLRPHAKPELPIITASKVSQKSNQPLAEKNKAQAILIPTNSLTVASSSIVNSTKQKKIDVLYLPQIIVGKMQNALIKSNSNVSGYISSPIEDGVPGHGGA